MLSNRVANYWNKIPTPVKEATSVNAFKARLERYKEDTVASGASSTGHFWDLSTMLLGKINDCGRESYSQFMLSNPMIAKYKGVNVN